jgi:hypothetical protein
MAMLNNQRVKHVKTWLHCFFTVKQGTGDSKIFIKPVSSYVDPRAVCEHSTHVHRKPPVQQKITPFGFMDLAYQACLQMDCSDQSKVRKKRPTCGHMERRAATENSREECQGP